MVTLLCIITEVILTEDTPNVPKIQLQNESYLTQFLDNLKDIPIILSTSIFAIVYGISNLLLLSGTPMNLAAGAFYGILLGTIVVTIGCNIAAFFGFIFGRTWLRNWVMQKVQQNATLLAVYNALGKGDSAFYIIFLTRLSPVFPFAILNYVFGLTQVSIRDYMIATTLGLIPGVALYCYIGSTIQNITNIGKDGSGDSQSTIAIILGLVVAVIVSIFVTVISKRAVNEAMNKTK